MTELEYTICSALNMYCFLNIWNEPVSEYRVNIRPTMLDTRSRSGSVSINGNMMELPRTDEPFYLYSISTSCFRNAFHLPTDVWVDGVTMCNENDILVHVYTEQGYMCSHGEIYLRLLPNESVYVLAVSKKMLSRLCRHENSDKIYVTIYRDSDIANKTTLYSYKVPTNDRNGTYRLEIAKQLQECNREQCIIYVNGQEVELDNPNVLDYGDFVDIVYDTNIIATYTLDLTDNTKYWTYYSEMDKLEKLIVHTPKELNPNNKVLTHNTADFFIRRKYPKQYREEGLYIHRTANRSISQITHNDFSIPMFIVDAYRDYLETQAVTVKVIIRQHDKDNLLVRDKNYIDMLYTQDDDTIVACLKGRQPHAPEFWKAEHLEQSVYVKMMFDIPDEITPTNMWYYVEGLGYYHTIGLLCERVTSTVVSDLWGGFLTFAKPYLFLNRTIYPIVYHNGKKIYHDDIVVTNDLDKGFSVSFLNDNIYKIGDTIDVEMFLDGNRNVFDIKVTEDERTIKVPYTDYIVYQMVDNFPALVKGVDYESAITYKKLDTLTGVATVQVDREKGKTTFVFSTRNIGDTFIIQNKYCVRPLDLTHKFREKINKGETLAFNLDVYSQNNNLVPLLEPQSVQVFINGKYLINGLDYFIDTVKGIDGSLSVHQLIIQNKSYLLGEDKDTIEVIVTSAEVEDSSFGFLKNDQITHSENKLLALWFPAISTSHIEGLMELNITNMSTYMEVPAGKYRQGAPYEITTNIPKIIKDFLDTYHENDDFERMVILNEYFYGIRKPTEGIIILPYSHQIYSVLVNTIINDVINGRCILAFDPDIPRMKKQVASYEYLKKYDLIFNDVSTIDTTYVDIFPTYSEYATVDPEMYKLIHALVKLLLPEDNFTSGEIVDVH